MLIKLCINILILSNSTLQKLVNIILVLIELQKPNFYINYPNIYSKKKKIKSFTQSLLKSI